MSELIRNAVSSGLRDPTALATASIEHRGESGGVRATLDLPRGVHRALQRLAADEETSLQALVVTAILQTYADWPNGSLMTDGLIHVYQDGRAFGRPGWLMAIHIATNAPNLIEQWPPTALKP
jgi:hypothetical protein